MSNILSADTDIIIGALNLKIEFEYNKVTNELKLRGATTTLEELDKEILTHRRTLSESEVRYRILTFGSKAAFSEELSKRQSEYIDVEFKGELFKGRVHATKGRVDSVGDIMKKYPDVFKEGNEIQATYYPHEVKLVIEYLN